MAIPTVYRSTDPGAPVVGANTTGSYLEMIRACLVDGYGSKAPAGWTEEFSGTNVAVFRNSAASGATGMYVRVEDAAAYTTLGNQAVKFDAYREMTDINTGVDKLRTGYGFRRPAGSTSVATTSWVVVATNKAAWVASWQVGLTRHENPIVGFGDAISLVENDAYRYFCAGYPVDSGTGVNWLAGENPNATGSPRTPPNANRGVPFGASHTGLDKNIRCSIWPQFNGGNIGGSTYPDRPSVTGAAEAVVPAYLCHGTNVLRGRLPGAYLPWSNITGLGDGDVVSDVVAPGSRLLLLRGVNSGIYIETALDWGD